MARAIPMPYVGRFAPSPTGAMHLGVARTLLAAWLDARKNGGRILLRVEDVDRPRVVPGAAEAIMRDMEWLGLDWDGAPTWQSAREDLYREALARLEAIGRAYPCTCSRREVQLAASAPHGPSDEGPRYPGTCRSGPKAPGRPASIRFKTEPGDRVTHTDLVYGDASQDVFEAVGDFVIRRSDGLWAYQLAVTADDLDQGVTRVVRGADLLSSTARQLLLRRVLDPSSPPLETLHVPLIRGPDGKRLAKRDGASGIASRREAGERAEHVIGLLASTLGLVPRGVELRAAELLAHWDPARIPSEDHVFDPASARFD